MKRLLYLMHVPWQWVKQRPHFIAEHLSEYFDVTVATEKLYFPDPRIYTRNSYPECLHFREVFKLPYLPFGPLLRLNALLVNNGLRRLVRGGFDIVWITAPSVYAKVRDAIAADQMVVYDCMDDILEFPNVRASGTARQALFEQEKALIERSSVIFASSVHLKDTLYARYGHIKEIVVVNNALDPDAAKASDINLPPDLEKILQHKGCNLAYIGTISEWLDVELLLESLEEMPAIRYLLFGPVDAALPKHERLMVCGPVDHKYVFKIMAMADGLIMPFRLNELVLSVDPVKLYEYISGCRPVVSVRYGETEKFRDFVYLYSGRDEYLGLIRQIAAGGLTAKKECPDCRSFAEKNTWPIRVRAMADRLSATES